MKSNKHWLGTLAIVISTLICHLSLDICHSAYALTPFEELILKHIHHIPQSPNLSAEDEVNLALNKIEQEYLAKGKVLNFTEVRVKPAGKSALTVSANYQLVYHDAQGKFKNKKEKINFEFEKGKQGWKIAKTSRNLL